MKRRLLCLVLTVLLLVAVPAYAASAAYARSVAARPSLAFDGKSATCSVLIKADYSTDRISVIMELRQGSTFIGRWSASGKGAVTINETATVSKNKTYKLIIAYTINGVAQDPISITRTNS